MNNENIESIPDMESENANTAGNQAKEDLPKLYQKLTRLSAKLPANRIKETDKGKAGQVLSYVTARFCMDRLDQAVGAHNWKNEYEVVHGPLICGVSIRCGDEWVTKWDVGTESTFEAEKGNFSDAFKRACVHWGIARELYQEGDQAFDEEFILREEVASKLKQFGAEEYAASKRINPATAAIKTLKAIMALTDSEMHNRVEAFKQSQEEDAA